MKVTIELDHKDFHGYADTITSFMRTVAGVGDTAPVSAPVHATQSMIAPIQAQLEPQEQPEPVNTNAPAVDSSGMPWDERIHSPNKTLIANGQWRKKKGVSDELVAAVEAERRGMPVQSAQPAMTAAQACPDISNRIYADPNPMQMMQQMQQQPIQAVQSVQPTQPMQPIQAVQPVPMQSVQAVQPMQSMQSQQAPADFPSFMKYIANGVNTQKIDANYIASLCQRCGINAITDLAMNPALIGNAFNLLIADGKA